MQDEYDHSRQKWILTELLLIILILLSIDVYYDLDQGVSLNHLYFEALAGFLGLSAIFFIWYKHIVPMDGELRQSIKVRHELQAELLHWKASVAPYATNIHKEIEAQFLSWQLTPAEKETALLLLKGLSLKEISKIRSVSEKTVKQHNLTIYQKSGLAGRAELSAFFLEDLLAIDPQKTSQGTAS